MGADSSLSHRLRWRSLFANAVVRVINDVYETCEELGEHEELAELSTVRDNVRTWQMKDIYQAKLRFAHLQLRLKQQLLIQRRKWKLLMSRFRRRIRCNSR
jgi:hypothetical protein